MFKPRSIPRILAFMLPLLIVAAAIGQSTPATPPAASSVAPEAGGLWPLFKQSFDLFSVLLISGSVAAVAIIVSCLMDVRKKNIVPERSLARMTELAKGARFAELSEFVRNDDSMVARIVRAAIESKATDRTALRETAELAASEESARWFRRVEPLNVIGNLGPLLGLAGTVWGMILAFTSLGVAGGQANPADLSLGISKALFHTLLGLCLAIPCLLVFGLYRTAIDRMCTRAMVVASEVVEKLPVDQPHAAPGPGFTAETQRQREKEGVGAR
jgi:biopolymer transport protein ExbB